MSKSYSNSTLVGASVLTPAVIGVFGAALVSLKFTLKLTKPLFKLLIVKTRNLNLAECQKTDESDAAGLADEQNKRKCKSYDLFSFKSWIIRL